MAALVASARTVERAYAVRSNKFTGDDCDNEHDDHGHSGPHAADLPIAGSFISHDGTRNLRPATRGRRRVAPGRSGP